MKTLAVLLLAAALPTLAACSERDAASDASAAAGKSEDTMVGRKVRQAMDKARAELATKNIDLDQVHVSGDGINIGSSDPSGAHAKAEITPQGDLLIDGRKVEANAEQRALLLAYRRHIEGIASAGMDIGAAGAELGVKAATEALKGIFSGNPDDIERRVEAQAEAIKASAIKLCDRLPAMLDTQNRLAAAMPEFRPYADLEQSDIDDCYENRDSDAQVAAKTGAGADAAAGGRASDDDRAMNAAAEAEAASEEDVGRN